MPNTITHLNQHQEKDIISYHVSGRIDDVSFKLQTQEILEKLDSPEHFNIYLEIEKIEGIDFMVIWDSLKLAFNNLADYLKQVDKIAVVTDIKWLRAATKIEDQLIPAIEERAFSLDQKDEATMWLRA